jgi:hypothetical protein
MVPLLPHYKRDKAKGTWKLELIFFFCEFLETISVATPYSVE